jgi:hypothetical protein
MRLRHPTLHSLMMRLFTRPLNKPNFASIMNFCAVSVIAFLKLVSEVSSNTIRFLVPQKIPGWWVWYYYLVSPLRRLLLALLLDARAYDSAGKLRQS